MSLYGLDESVRGLLKLDRFGAADFSTKQFIEKLSVAPHATSSSSTTASTGLDPKPYIRTFEAVATELQRLHEIAAHQEEAADRETQKLNRERNEDLLKLATNVDACVMSVRKLDEDAGELARAAGPLGERLELLTRQHTQISDARQLVSAYLSFLRRGQSPELSRLWASTAPGDRRKCAQMVGQLQSLAQKIGPVESNKDLEDQINKFAEQVEMGLIDSFQEAYHVFDLTGMREIASILYDFNGGTSVVQAYVNQHDFFMQVQKQLETTAEDPSKADKDAMWRELADPTSDYQEFRKLFEQLVSEIVNTVIQETEVTAKVFPNPVQVLSVFLQRIFAQRIQGIVMDYLSEAQSLSQHTHLVVVRVLYVCYSQIKNMLASLKDVWSQPRFGLSVYSQGELATVLDSNFGDTFGLFIDDYFNNELAALKDIIRSTFQPFYELNGISDASSSSTNGHQRTQSRDSDHTLMSPVAAEDEHNTLDRMDRWMRAARSRLRTAQEVGQSVGQSSMGLLSPGSSSPEPSGAGGVRAGGLDTRKTQLVLVSFAECIARQQVLRPSHWWAHDAVLLFNLLLTEVGGGYINVALENVIQRTSTDGRHASHWAFLDVVNGASRSLQLFAAFVKTALLAMVSLDQQASAEMASKLNQYVSSVQEQCSAVVELAADIAHARVQELLGKQRKRDFTEPEMTSSGSVAVSNAAAEICTEFEALGHAAADALTPDNSQRLLKVVADTFYDDWMAHISKFTVSPAGGQALAADTAAYERIIVHDWSLSELGETFATMRTIAKVFAVDASLLPSLMRDSHLSKLKGSQVRSILAQRADYQSKGVSLLFLNNMHTRYR